MHSTKLILASKSPRRKQLLSDAGFEFEIKTVAFTEVFSPEVLPEKMAEHLAIGKNDAHRKAFLNETILTSDTVVIANENVLGKPVDKYEAVKMIEGMNDKVHSVISGVCISNSKKKISFSSKTEVKFHELSLAEITYYVDEFQPYDKAGGYGIQEWIGMIGIEWIKGSYFNVVGMPIDKVYRSLKDDFNIIPRKMKSLSE